MSDKPPSWSPPLAQDPVTKIVYFENETRIRYNVYSLGYTTTYTLQPGTYTFGDGSRNTDISSAITNIRSSMIGVVPLIRITSDNSNTPITYSFPTNDYSISIITLERDYYVIPQPGASTGMYSVAGAAQVRLPYRNVLIINGVFDSSGGYSPSISSTVIPMEIKQAAFSGFYEKKINLPIILTRAPTNLTIKSFDLSAGSYTISDIRNKTPRSSTNQDFLKSNGKSSLIFFIRPSFGFLQKQSILSSNISPGNPFSG